MRTAVKGLVRNETGAVVAVDDTRYQMIRKDRSARNRERELRSEVDQLRSMVSSLLQEVRKKNG